MHIDEISLAVFLIIIFICKFISLTSTLFFDTNSILYKYFIIIIESIYATVCIFRVTANYISLIYRIKILVRRTKRRNSSYLFQAKLGLKIFLLLVYILLVFSYSFFICNISFYWSMWNTILNSALSTWYFQLGLINNDSNLQYFNHDSNHQDFNHINNTTTTINDDMKS